MKAHRTLRTAALACTLFGPSAALAQAEVFFGNSEKPVVFREEDLDKRFAKTKLAKALAEGTAEPGCVQLLGGLFTLLGEAAPTFHKRDENFYLDPMLVGAMNGQLSNARFPGNAYFVAMVRRVMIDRKLPESWLHLANAINGQVMIIDMGKLRFLAEGVRPVDSYFFTLAALRQQYELEVLRANTAARDNALVAFRDGYLDREVAWGGLRLVDVGPPEPVKPAKGKGSKGKKAKAPVEPAPTYLVARLEVPEAVPHDAQIQLFGKTNREPPTIIEARLSETQYLDLKKLPRGKRMMVRGRFWEMSDDLKRLELRNALLFEDRDWAQGAVLADPNAVAQCSFALNDLTGTAPVQPGGFGQRPGQPQPTKR